MFHPFFTNKLDMLSREWPRGRCMSQRDVRVTRGERQWSAVVGAGIRIMGEFFE